MGSRHPLQCRSALHKLAQLAIEEAAPAMNAPSPDFHLKLADSESDLRGAQGLRYRVFVEELGANGVHVDHVHQLERDGFDPYLDHLLLLDRNRHASDQVVGVYRLLRGDIAERIGQFYSEDEFDLDILRRSGRRLLELGRSCVHVDYRGGTAMYELWAGLVGYVTHHNIEVLFGVASFHGTDAEALAGPLSYLYHRHLAPPELRVTARPENGAPMGQVPLEAIDRRAAMLATPALIKAYLRLGGFVGQGAWIDHAFNTTDVCLILDVERIGSSQRAIYSRGRSLTL